MQEYLTAAGLNRVLGLRVSGLGFQGFGFSSVSGAGSLLPTCGPQTLQIRRSSTSPLARVLFRGLSHD